jgi:hypothetical protein
MDLFSMGVIDDDDRTPRERRPKEPVRCLDSELLPPLPKVRTCECGNHVLRGRDICGPCDRERQLRDKRRREHNSQADARFRRMRARMVRGNGIAVETTATARTLADFVAAGNARWATRRDLHRFGLPDGTRAAVLIGWPE